MRLTENSPSCCARFRVAGDLIVHQKLLDCALRPDGSYDFHPHFALVKDMLKNADYTIANLETTVGKVGELPYSGYPRFNTPETILDTLRDAGVDFLTLANNHILDCGIDGLQTTADKVRAWGFDFGGVSRTPERKEKPVVVDICGIRVGFLCYTGIMNIVNSMESEAEAVERAEALGVKTLQHADFSADVRCAREAGAELVFALPHWGEEYRRKPEDATVALAKKMVAAGVNVILGSHSHMVQPVEYLKAMTENGRTRTGLVAYSLGNFISNQAERYTDSGIILDFTVRRMEGGGFSVENVCILPTYCWRQESRVQTLCSKKYLNAAPEGMDAGTWHRLKESYEELQELIGEDFLIADE